MKGLRDYWRWLGKELGLTVGGRIAFTVVGLLVGGLGLVGAVADAALGGEHGDQEGGVLLVFVVVALGFSLVLVVALDAAFRGARWVVRRFA